MAEEAVKSEVFGDGVWLDILARRTAGQRGVRSEGGTDGGLLHAPSPATFITVNRRIQIPHARGQHQLSTHPNLARGIHGLEVAAAATGGFPNRFDLGAFESDGRVALEQIGASLLPILGRVPVIPGRHVVHVCRQRIAIDARVEDDGSVKLPRETGCDGKAGRTAADDEDVGTRGRRHGEEDLEVMRLKLLNVQTDI